jgi:hypothetical protein
MPSEESRQLKRLIGPANLQTGNRAMHEDRRENLQGANLKAIRKQHSPSLFRSTLAYSLATAILACIATVASAQSVPVVTGDARVDKLLSQMTLEEKLTLIHGTKEDPSVYQGQAGYLAGIPRLGIPGLRFADGPPGVLTRHPSQGETATMGVAATFSVKDAEDNGIVIGREDRALGIDVSLQPFVNIDRDLEFGRGYNTLGRTHFLPAKWVLPRSKAFNRST